MPHRIRIATKPARAAHADTTGAPTTLKLLSIREAADYAKVSTQTVRRAIKAGDLKIYRMGRQIRIDESDFVNYLSS